MGPVLWIWSRGCLFSLTCHYSSNYSNRRGHIYIQFTYFILYSDSTSSANSQSVFLQSNQNSVFSHPCGNDKRRSVSCRFRLLFGFITVTTILYNIFIRSIISHMAGYKLSTCIKFIRIPYPVSLLSSTSSFTGRKHFSIME